MIEIKHKETGEVLHTVEADTLINADLRRADLRGAHLTGAHLKEADLREAHLEGANLRGTDLSQSYLIGADLRDACLSRADLSQSYLTGANLRGADLNNINLFCAFLIGTNLREADLIGADLRDACLSRADLSQSYLSGAKMKEAYLSGADLREAYLNRNNLNGANLSRANLRGTDLTHADLSGADLSGTGMNNVNLSGADLSGANMKEAYLSGVNLRGADLSDVDLGYTTFGMCPTLHLAKNLESIKHHGPSYLDVATLRASITCLHDVFLVFLRGVGYTIDEIDYLRSYYATSIQLFSCFISYRKTDYDFAIRLHNELEANNVPCWIDERDMRGGKLWRPQIHEAIRFHDKLLLVCSEEAVSRRNVVDEIITAIEQERETGEQKLFPVRLDDFILSEVARKLADEKTGRGEWREDWIRYVQAFHIPDFRRWKQHDAFQRQFDNLLRALKNPAKR